MNEITKKQPDDEGRRGDAVIMDWCWKNQDEEKCGEEGINGEFNTHGSGESLKGVGLKRRREMSTSALSLYRNIRGRRLTREQDAPVMHVDRVRMPVQQLSTRGERQQQAACQMENNVHVGLVAWSLNLSLRHKRTKGLLAR
jgi:hypothetical protein